MKIAITGATGNMGRAVMNAISAEAYIEEIRVLSHSSKRTKSLLKKNKKLKKKIVVVEGSVADEAACRALADGVDIVLNFGAVIPPKSDQNPKSAIECNEVGANVLVSVIEGMENQPMLLHTSTVAL
ncbi:MAG: polysaccharide biosynthesis protein, partial [Clostridia bacterium]|nr:polysaccharide biosynthesis protein [Clostridia bacterium]